MMPLFRSSTAVLALALLAGNSAAQSTIPAQSARAVRDSLVITFLANEGVMISTGGASVLIDALFGDGLPGYRVVSPPVRALLERARPPFDRVSAVLATHIHRDHFDAPAVFTHLRSNAGATFISSTDAVGLVRAVDPAVTQAMTARLVGVSPSPGQRVRVGSLSGVTIDALGLPHGERSDLPVNVGFVVDIGGRRVLHIGDSDAGAAEFATLRLDELGIDVALLPPHYLRVPELREIVRRQIKPKAIAVIHGPPASEGILERLRGGWAREIRGIQKEFPNARSFTRELETWVIR